MEILCCLSLSHTMRLNLNSKILNKRFACRYFFLTILLKWYSQYVILMRINHFPYVSQIFYKLWRDSIMKSALQTHCSKLLLSHYEKQSASSTAKKNHKNYTLRLCNQILGRPHATPNFLHIRQNWETIKKIQTIHSAKTVAQFPSYKCSIYSQFWLRWG